ncbi:MAG: molybdenum cofactor biosynthesis protein MoaE [Deinococcota bacterium]|nr:molybdenum cofactor biosynthesis protein MoaE [Deinococcota bacterium]
MRVELLLFASYREAVGKKSLSLELEGGARIRDVAAGLERDYPGLRLQGALAAVNERYASPDDALFEGDTLAFFPPVSGGSGEQDLPGDIFVVTREALNFGGLIARASALCHGALACFFGTVRSPNAGSEVAYIDYEGYESMMRRQMEVIAAEARERHDLGRVVIAHRLGRLLPGEASIAIVVASRHRLEALAACHYCIDRSKELLPVWKYEVSGEGGSWLAGSSAAAEPL